jgi:hypothetical protein
MITAGKSDAVSAEFRRKRFAQQAARTALLLQEKCPSLALLDENSTSPVSFASAAQLTRRAPSGALPSRMDIPFSLFSLKHVSRARGIRFE